jgi:hypothetical protein
MLKTVRLICLVIILSVAVLFPTIVMSATITVTNAPDYVYSGGIINFTITPVGDNQLDFSWGYSGNVTGIMIRGKYAAYPDNIPDIHTEPSDGFLIYSGNATSTSWYFDENISDLFIRAWGHNSNGTWRMDTNTGIKGTTMTLIALFLVCGILTYVGVRSSYYPLKFFAGVSWLFMMIYWLGNPPSSIVVGSTTHTVGMLIFIGMSLAMILMPFWYTKNKDGVEIGRFRVPFLSPTEEDEEAERQRRHTPSRQERTNAYADRLDAALRGERRRR